ncbi:hypothetical protein pb186bvf_018485 [Paramecium bursaria]
MMQLLILILILKLIKRYFYNYSQILLCQISIYQFDISLLTSKYPNNKVLQIKTNYQWSIIYQLSDTIPIFRPQDKCLFILQEIRKYSNISFF